MPKPVTVTQVMLDDYHRAVQELQEAVKALSLKERQKEIYDRLEAQWFEWNAMMLPEIDESFTSNFTGDHYADHIGVRPTSTKADNPKPRKNP